MILIVDDDSAVRSSLSFMLKRAGYEVNAAPGPREAMEIVRNESPVLILMDMNFTLSTTGEEGLTLLNEPILSKFHHSGEWRPTEEDWKALAQIIDKTYNGFTYRLKVTAPSLEERDIRACLLLKIGVRRKNMAPLLFMTESGVSMHHVRLYRKITGQKTKSSISLRDFIRDF